MKSKTAAFAALKLFILAAGTLVHAPGYAQSYPSRPVTWVVPSPAGGVTDLTARIVAKALSAKIGQPVIVDPRPGAGGIVATEFVAGAKPDGYTLLYATSGTIATNPWIYKKLSYDPFKSFTPIHTLHEASLILAVPASSPFKTVNDFVTYARANPGKINFGSAGAGTGQHFAFELFQSAADLKATHVPYRGSTPSITDLTAGVTDAAFDYYGPLKSLLEAGKLRALAVTGSRRSPVMKDTPTLAELGYRSAVWSGWSTVVAPAGTPPDVVDFLAKAFAETLLTSDVLAYIESTGSQALPVQSKEGVEAFHRSESDKVKRLVEATGVSAD
jgi:tripartite-type tricarboxylate transporter receptor subunit TctC